MQRSEKLEGGGAKDPCGTFVILLFVAGLSVMMSTDINRYQMFARSWKSLHLPTMLDSNFFGVLQLEPLAKMNRDSPIGQNSTVGTFLDLSRQRKDRVHLRGDECRPEAEA